MLRWLSGSAALLAAIVVAGGLSAADWPTFRHGADRVATTAESIGAPLALQWRFTSPAAPQTAWSGPRSTPIEGHVMRHRVRFDDAIQVAAAGGRVYFGSPVDHRLHCVDAKTGQPLWDFFTEGPIRLAPTIDGDRVLFGSDDGIVYCLNRESGALVWKYRPALRDERLLARGQMISRWPIRTGVLVDDGVAYFGAGIFPHELVYLCAVEAATGEVIWKNDVISEDDAGRNDLSPQGYLLANEELLFVPSGRSLPVAFDKKTGQMRHGRQHAWRSTAGGVVG
ncbi:MAG: PQQ-binding-like beta-propeller repeat protein, partial [Planctomycetales bacterium]|nr:PQQ-binding-like beta-propeller repeat protein [Planctomycetales bacterium]